MASDTLSQCGDNEDLDPRIQHELDTLNKASVDINVLERSLEEERQNYETLFSGVTQNLNYLQAKLKSAIEKSRPYYDMKEKVKIAHSEAQTAAKRYDRAISTHQAAQQMVSVAETGFQNSSRASRSASVEIITSDEIEAGTSLDSNATKTAADPNTSGSFDLAWQEMLNVAVSKVYEAEKELTDSEIQHQTKMKACVALEAQLKALEKNLKSSIKKSRPYYETKSVRNFQLEEQLRRIKHLEVKIVESKQKYTAALCNLEAISEEIHFRRESKLGPRGQGVGAEHTETQLGENETTVNKSETISEETVILFDRNLPDNFDQKSSVTVTPKHLATSNGQNNTTSKPSSMREGPIGADADVKTPKLATQKSNISDKLTASTESKSSVTSLRSQFSALTPEDAKKLAKGETNIGELLNLSEEGEEREMFSAKIESDIKKLSANDLSSSFQNISTRDVDNEDDYPSTVSTPVKLRRRIESESNSRSSSTAGHIPSSSSASSTVGKLNHSRSKSEEKLYQNPEN